MDYEDISLNKEIDSQTEALILVFEGRGQESRMGIPAAPKGVPKINVCMNIYRKSELRVAVVYMPGS
jgi:heat shock protein 4